MEIALSICTLRLHPTNWEAFYRRKSWAQGRRAQKSLRNRPQIFIFGPFSASTHERFNDGQWPVRQRPQSRGRRGWTSHHSRLGQQRRLCGRFRLALYFCRLCKSTYFLQFVCFIVKDSSKSTYVGPLNWGWGSLIRLMGGGGGG